MRKVLIWYGPHHQRVWRGDTNHDWSPFGQITEAREWAEINGYAFVDSSADWEPEPRRVGQMITVKAARVYCNGVTFKRARRAPGAERRGVGGHLSLFLY